MDITFKSQEGCRKTYSIHSPWDEVEPKFREVVRAVRGQAHLHGFRPGKAPEGLVKGRFQKEIREEVLERFLPDAARETLQKFSLDPVVEPYVEAVQLEEGHPFVCDLHVEVAPEVPEVNAQGIVVRCPRAEVKEAQVDRVLEGLRERAAVMKPQEVASEGDYLSVTMRRKGQAKGQDLFLRALADSHHPAERALSGRKTAEVFDLKVEPEAGEGEPGHDSPHAHLAPGEYEFTVNKIVRREVPPLGDDLAKDLGAESLEALRDRVRKDVEARLQAEMRALQEDRLIEALLDKYPVPAPPTLADRQLREDLQSMAEEWARQGLDPTKAGVNWEEIARSRRSVSERKVSAYYLLKAVAERNGLTVAEDELAAYFQNLAEGSRMPADRIRARYEKEGRLDDVRDLLARKKALGLLLSQASVTLVEAEPVPAEEG
ncbi:MAG: trigger factor [Acidobacteriota bacterium]